MLGNKKVSIILCFYNEEKYLAKSIESILAQTYSNFELIIVNDGSTDNSEQIVQAYDDDRIIYYAYTGNRRLAYARNRGLELASGEYVGFFDADDIMLPDRLARQVAYLDQHKDTIVVGGGYTYIDSEGRGNNRIVHPICYSDEEIKAYMLFGNGIAVGSALFCKKIVDTYNICMDETNKASEDFKFWIDMLPYGKFVNIDEVFYQYRINHGSKAQIIVKSNEEAYKEEIKSILQESWKQRGFKLQERDFDFLYNYLFKGNRTLNPRIMIQGIIMYQKIKRQSIQNQEERRYLILKYFKRCWMDNYYVYWLLKK